MFFNSFNEIGTCNTPFGSGGFGNNAIQKKYVPFALQPNRGYANAGMNVLPNDVVLQECECTRLSVVWNSWRSNLSKPLKIVSIFRFLLPSAFLQT